MPVLAALLALVALTELALLAPAAVAQPVAPDEWPSSTPVRMESPPQRTLQAPGGDALAVGTDTMGGYLFDNAAEQEAEQRFGSLAVLYDPHTLRCLERTGVGPGWRCLEVGAGGGSIATWLADQVGSSGHVTATDIDPRFLRALRSHGRPNVEVLRHDVTVDPLPEAAFDLIHARLVFVHLPAAREALDHTAVG